MKFQLKKIYLFVSVGNLTFVDKNGKEVFIEDAEEFDLEISKSGKILNFSEILEYLEDNEDD